VPIQRTIEADALRYRHVTVEIDRAKRTATFTVARRSANSRDGRADRGRGAGWWPLEMARELDDAILSMRTNELDIGIWLLKTEGDAAAVLATDAVLLAHAGPLVRARDDRPAQPHLLAARRVVAFAVRARRAGLVLRGHDAGTRAGLRPHVHARAARRPRPRAEARGVGCEFRVLPDGHWPDASRTPLLRRGALRSTPCARASASR
jgi:hypothetical protein